MSGEKSQIPSQLARKHGKMYKIFNSLDTWENINDVLKESQSENGQDAANKSLSPSGVDYQLQSVSCYQFLHLKTRATGFPKTSSWFYIPNWRLLAGT